MADDTAPAPVAFDPDQIAAMLQRLQLQPPTQAPASTADGPGAHGFAGFIGDVGNVLGGGGSGLLGLGPEEEAAAGRRALMAAGVNMLIGGGPSYYPKNFGTVLGGGLQAAMQSRDQSERDVFAAHGSQQQLAQQAYENRLKSIKEALPLLTLQYNQQLLDAQRRSAQGGGAPNTSISAAAANPDGATIGQRQNNPGNLTFAGQPYASPGQGNRFASFPDMATGVAANADQLAIYQTQHGINTVRDAVTKWVSDPKADLTSYIADISTALGVKPDDKIDLTDPAVQQKFIQAQFPHESAGGGYKLDPAVVQKGVQMAAARRGKIVQPTPQVAAATPPPAAPAAATPPGRVQVATADTGTATDATIAPAAAEPVENYTDPTKPFLYKAAPIPEGVVPSGDLSPDEKAAVLARKTANSSRIADINSQLRVEADAPTIAKLREEKRNLGADNATADQEAAKAKAERTTAAQAVVNKFNQDDYAQKKARYEAAIKAQQDAALEKQKGDQQLAQTKAQGEEARQTEATKSDNAFTLDTRKKLTDERTAAQETVDNLGLLDNLSKAAGAATPLDSLNWGGMPLRQWLLQKNIGSADQIAHWGAQQAYEAAINQTVIGLRKGVSMGQLSDRDLSFLQGMSPSVLQRPETREAITAYLRSAQLRKIRFADSVDELWDGGKGMSYGQALVAARKQLPDIVPQVPAGLSNADKRDWFTKSVPPGTLYRNSQGDLTVWPGMPGSQ